MRPPRQDEIDLWNSFGPRKKHRCPREAIEEMGMNWKRASYLLLKWANQGRYDYGVSLSLGWKVESGTVAIAMRKVS